MRREFTKETKRAALRRSKGLCEAAGRAYGFPPRHRCSSDLAFGVEFDHYPVRAADGGSNDLENCAAVCIRCHRWKTGRRDIPEIAKSKRIRDKRWNIRDDPQRSFAGGRLSGLKRKLNGQVTSR